MNSNLDASSVQKLLFPNQKTKRCLLLKNEKGTSNNISWGKDEAMPDSRFCKNKKKHEVGLTIFENRHA